MATPLLANNRESTIDFSAPPVIDIERLRKVYGRHVALDDLNVRVPRAAIGLLGSNGAGKTTLIKILLGLSRPNRGTATVLGFDTAKQGIELRARVGYMPESDALPTGATASDFVAHMAEMSGLPSRAARQRANDVLYQVGLDEERYRLIKGFSTGMKQRVKLAQAIVHDPDLVFLDEPTNGMDPQGREEMLALISRIHQKMGIAVVISSHILEDIERVCDYVTILSSGKLILAEPMSAIGAGATEMTVRIEGDSAPFRAALDRAGLPSRVADDDEGLALGDFMVPMRDDGIYDVIRDVAADQGAALRLLRPRARTLEDVYLGNVAAAQEQEAVGATSK
ncbi:ABC transporter ATP-binding protein [soil metagenome]